MHIDKQSMFSMKGPKLTVTFHTYRGGGVPKLWLSMIIEHILQIHEDYMWRECVHYKYKYFY